MNASIFNMSQVDVPEVEENLQPQTLENYNQLNSRKALMSHASRGPEEIKVNEVIEEEMEVFDKQFKN